jgi:hypothetical protein
VAHLGITVEMIRSLRLPRCRRGTPSSSMSKSWPISSRNDSCAASNAYSSLTPDRSCNNITFANSDGGIDGRPMRWE